MAKSTGKASKKTSQKSPKVEPFYQTSDNVAISTHLSGECSFAHGQPKVGNAHATVRERQGYNRRDQDSARPEDRIPTNHQDIIQATQALYRRVGIVRNVIDMMSDFAAEGMKFEHPIKSQKRFYDAWAEKTDLANRSHDFMKLLLRDANVIVRRKTARISVPLVNQMSKATISGLSVTEDIAKEIPENVTIDKRKGGKREIPWKYTFLSPVMIEKIGGSVGKFFGDNTLAMRIPAQLRKSITSPVTDAEKEFVKKIPAEIREAVKRKKGDNLVKLDPDKMYVDYYKKDDWEDWGTPFLYGVMEDIMFKQKMRLADMAALDGVINTIRLWKLGNSEQKILPTKTAVNKLLDILQHNVGGGTMDIVWDDMIELNVEYPPTDKILGTDKYKSVDSDIIQGLGIPDSLIGGAGQGTRNAESAYVQLKTLLERLEYIRGRAIAWIKNELKMVADAMGFKHIPNVIFSIMSLRNEAAEKQLIIQLLDRGIISVESVQQVFGLNFAVELQNLKDEQAVREAEPTLLEKTNPYFTSLTVLERQHEFTMELERLKQDGGGGGGGPNEMGDQPRDRGKNPSGRPPNTVDTNPRKERDDQTQSVYKVQAERYIKQIDEIADPLFLAHVKAANLRSLTKQQKHELELTKRAMLAVVDKDGKISSDILRSRLASASKNLFEIYNSVFDELWAKHTEVVGKAPNLRERRSLCASAWAMLR